ncbi:MAG: sulfur reduction protein DsrJ [Pseudomonadota bacterium]
MIRQVSSMSIAATVKGIAWSTLAMLMMVTGTVQADPEWRQNGTSEAAAMAREGGQCVRETNWMRRYHMELLDHDRDLTVIQGVRDVDGSISGCVSCHANKDTRGHAVAVNGDDQFCAGCHDFAGVTLDCFQCHATVPTE